MISKYNIGTKRVCKSLTTSLLTNWEKNWTRLQQNGSRIEWKRIKLDKNRPDQTRLELSLTIMERTDQTWLNIDFNWTKYKPNISDDSNVGSWLKKYWIKEWMFLSYKYRMKAYFLLPFILICIPLLDLCIHGYEIRCSCAVVRYVQQ